MNVLEKHFLFGINFRAHVTLDDFYSYASLLHREMLFESPPLTHAPMVLQAQKRKCSCSKDKFAPKKQKLTIWVALDKQILKKLTTFLFYFLFSFGFKCTFFNNVNIDTIWLMKKEELFNFLKLSLFWIWCCSCSKLIWHCDLL